MKTAKEMFEELGFKLFEFRNNNFQKVKCFEYEAHAILITFNLEDMTLTVSKFNSYGTYSNEIMEAITQQMKELGWIK